MEVSALILSVWLILLARLAQCDLQPPAAHDVFTEAIVAQGLLGSHFGVPGLDAQYDYVVVGGGTAGLTIARRLAEDSRFSVAVIDAGDFYEFANGNNTEIPAFASTFTGSNPILRNPLLDWYQWTEKQAGLAGRRIMYASGKVLGGGSARNYMWFHRASKEALQKWADLTGDDGYLFENLLPFYQKSVQFTPPNAEIRLSNSTTLYNESLWSPDGGPLQVGYPHWVNPISSWIVRGMEALGLKALNGFADGDISGYSYTTLSLDAKTQTRSSSETSFLRDALLHTTNLNVYKSTLAKSIVFDNEKRATGAIVQSGNVEYRINATREVIVSTGVFRSPQLLMVSGIGPRQTLEQNGINVISDLQGVGQNMWDHITFGPAYAVNLLTHSSLSNPDFMAEQNRLYRENRTGMLTNSAGDVLAFTRFPDGSISDSMRSELDSFSPDWPDYEHAFLDGYFGYGNDPSEAPTDGRNYVSSATALMNPFSRGNVTITSNDTNDYPLISPNWLLDPRDQEVAVAAFKRARAVFTNDATREIVLGDEVFPGLNVSTNAQIFSLIQQSALTLVHASCTCAMGLANNTMAVSDSRARVYGVTGLRVVDASSFPVLPPGHPTATVYALAEKIADAILHEDA